VGYERPDTDNSINWRFKLQRQLHRMPEKRCWLVGRIFLAIGIPSRSISAPLLLLTTDNRSPLPLRYVQSVLGISGY
jgi:hypothetical protein